MGHALDMDQVRAWYLDDKKSIREISRLTGASTRTVWRHMSEAGIPRREPGPSGPMPGQGTWVPPEEDAAIRAALAVGEEIEAIAARLGRSPATIARRRPPELSRESTDQARAAGRAAKVIDAHACGLRGAETDREHDWPPGTAARMQRQLGLDPARPFPAYEAVRLYGELGTLGAVSRALGHSRSSGSVIAKIREALLSAGITPNPRPPREPHHLYRYIDGIRRAYVDEKVAVPILAAWYDVTPGALVGFLYRYGITRYRRLTTAEHDQLVALAAAGMTKTRIAEEMSVSFPTVTYHLADRPRPRLEVFKGAR